HKGMAVVTPLGAVGQVVAVTARTAKVLLLADPNNGVDDLVQRNRARGIVSGSLENGTTLKYVRRSGDDQEGERPATSGFRRCFPQGYRRGNRGQSAQTNPWPFSAH